MGFCGATIQNNRIWKAKFSCVCSANLELTVDDRSRRFYFNEQFQWTFENQIVSPSLQNCVTSRLCGITYVKRAREHKCSYLLLQVAIDIYHNFYL